MSYTFNKNPEYENKDDKVYVDIRLEGDYQPLSEVIETFMSFLQASGFDKEAIINAFADIAEDELQIPIRDDRHIKFDASGYPNELL